MAMPMHEPTEELRAKVRALSSFGIKQDDIATYIGVAPKTLRLHYREELDCGTVEANAKVAECLFKNATEHNNVTAQIFWQKTRAGWSEKMMIEHSGAIGSGPDITKLTDEQLEQLRAIVVSSTGEPGSD